MVSSCHLKMLPRCGKKALNEAFVINMLSLMRQLYCYSAANCRVSDNIFITNNTETILLSRSDNTF